VDLDVFEANVEAADRLAQGTGKRIRPHVKTHRTPALALRQQTAVAIGATCATVGEAEAMVEAGIDDVLVANEVVSPRKIERLVALASRVRVGVAVDSEAGLANLSEAASRAGASVDVLVDVDVGLGRCGVPSAEAARDMAARAEGAPGVRFAGLMGYEGRIRASREGRAAGIADAYDRLEAAAKEVESAGLNVGCVSSAGTSTLPEALEAGIVTEIQAGTYCVMESDLDGLGLPFRHALWVGATAISTAPRRAVLDAGRKSLSCDYGPPVPLLAGADVKSVHEEHTTLELEDSAPPIGSMVRLRPGHARLTCNLHDAMWLVRGSEVVDRVPVSARGRSD
jgi:D-serine deaminase-like pyridoxal phosphate-dependent protein